MKTLTPAFALMQGAIWAIYGSIYSYSSVYLLSCNLSNTAIGLCLGATIGVCFFLQILAGEVLNRSGRTALMRFLAGCSILLLALCLLLLFLRPGLWAVSPFLAVCLLIQLLPALINSAGVYELQLGAGLNVGVGRGTGSLGCAVCSVVVGRLLVGTDTRPMFVAGLALSAALAVGCLWFHARAAGCPEQQAAAPSGGLNLRFLRLYPTFALVLCGMVLIMLGHTFVSNFLYQITAAKGGNEWDTGIAGAIAAVAELPALFAFGYLSRRASCALWLKLSGLLLVFKLLTAFLAEGVPALWASELLQVGYGLFTVSGIYYASRTIPHRDSISAQAYLGAASTLGVFLSLLLGGGVIDQLGVPMLLLLGTLSAALGTAVVCLATGRRPDGPA